MWRCELAVGVDLARIYFLQEFARFGLTCAGDSIKVRTLSAAGSSATKWKAVAGPYGIAINSVKSTMLGETKAAAFGIEHEHALREMRFVEIDVTTEPDGISHSTSVCSCGA